VSLSNRLEILLTIISALHSLQGALGRTSGRSYKAAPRQLLQVDPNNVGTSPTLSHTHAHISKEDALRPDGEGAAKEAAKLGREALGDAAPVRIPASANVACSCSSFIDRRCCSKGTAFSSSSPCDLRELVRSCARSRTAQERSALAR
jgi:hypothetical protein